MKFDAYIADGEDTGETLGAIRSALVGLRPGAPILFSHQDSSPVEESWGSWIDERFLPLIAPHLMEVRDACQPVAPKEVSELDRAFAAQLDPDETTRSTRAAHALKEALKGARHRPELDKVLAVLGSDEASGESQGQFPTLFAARCASHHVSVATTLAAYLFFELGSGNPGSASDSPPSTSPLPLILPPVRRALDSRPPISYRVA